MKIVMSLVLSVFGMAAAACFAQPQSPGVMLGAFIPATNDYTETILAFDQNTDFRHTHTLLFCDFVYDFEQWPYLLEQVRAAGKIPIITWQPGVNGGPHASFSNYSFIRGDHDAGIIKMAMQIKNFVESSPPMDGPVVYMRFAHEPNIRASAAWPGYEWNNQSIDEYIEMFRYVHDLFYSVLGDAGERVVWTWSVNYMNDGTGYDTFSNWKNLYPGDRYVHMIGLSGLNYGDHPTAGPGYSVSVTWLYMPVLRDMMAGGYSGAGAGAMLRELAAVSGGKPQGIFEFGTVGASFERMGETYSTIPKPQWILQGYDAIRTMEEFLYVRLVIWYNDIATTSGLLSDFRVAQNPHRDENPVPPSWTQAYRDAIHGVPFFLEQPLTLEEMTPDGFYIPQSLITRSGYPQHELWLNVLKGGTLQRGSILSATYFLYPSINATPQNPDMCDIYLVARIPNGRFYSFVPPGRWVPFNAATQKPTPAVKNFGVRRESRGMAFTLGTQGLPLGQYTIYSILVPPGADPRRGGPDMKISTFYIGQ